jgi:predicted ATP-grasp superfamily ATP-dependent carboligase
MSESTKTILITLGRLPKCLDIARSFHKLGWRVIVAEPFAWHLTRMSNVVAKTFRLTAPNTNREKYLSELTDIIQREKVSLVVPVSEEILHVSFLRKCLPEGVTLYAMPSALLLRLHNKRTFIDVCREIGVSAPETALLAEERASEIAAAGDYISKPIFSCSGRGVTFHQRGDTLPAVDPAAPMIVQRWVKGNVLSTFSIARSGVVLTTVVYRGAVMSGSVAVAFERIAESHPGNIAIQQWVNQFVKALNFTGFISFDFIQDAEGHVHAIECNPRATSGAHFIYVDDLAQAVIGPTMTPGDIAFRDEILLQQFYPCLTEVQKAMFTSSFFPLLNKFIRAKDVTWSWRDPLPFWTMTFTASQIIWLSIKHKATFGEVATLDVGWYKDTLTHPPHQNQSPRI